MQQLSANELHKIYINAARNKQFFLLKRAIPGMQHLNILVGCLETNHVNYLYNCQSLQCAPNSSSIAQAVDEAVRSLGINRNSFCLLLPDVAKYMVAADSILTSLYPKLFHVTCVAHLLHDCVIKSNLTLKMTISSNHKSQISNS